MAHFIEQAPDVPPAALTSCFSDILGDTKIRRSLVKISSAQNELIRRNESWESALSQRPNGFVNVPPDVLEQLKASHTRQKRAAQSHVSMARSPIGDLAQASEPFGSQGSSHHVEGEEGADNKMGSDNDTDMSWSHSSDAHLHPPNADSEEPSQPFVTQIPEKSPPPQATVLTSPGPIYSLNSSPSSQGPEDELEVEVPAALAHCPIPINKTAQTMLATPPSAQIPCTFDQYTQSFSTDDSANLNLQPKAQPKQTVYKPIPKLYQPSKQDTGSLVSRTKAGAFKGVPDLKEVVASGSSLSSDNTSMSFIPSTVIDNQHLETMHASTSDNDIINSRDRGCMELRRSPSLVEMPPPSSQVSCSPHPSTSVTRPVASPAVAPQDREPSFGLFRATYPSYRGTMEDFVMACSYIQGQGHRIRTSLYDDFIRAWAEGYLPYVEECDSGDPPRQVMEAIEWYNQIDDDPLFTSRVVTRQNLASVLETYPDELKPLRTYINFVSRQAPKHLFSPSIAAPNLQGHESTRQRNQSNKNFPTQASVEAHALESRSSAFANQTNRPYPAGPYMPTPRPFSVAETRQEQLNASTKSIEATSSHKRLADHELHRDATKRLSRNPMSNARDNMAIATGGLVGGLSGRLDDHAQGSVSPESTRTRNLTSTEDQEERRRQRLAKHFKKRMAGQN